MTTANHGRMLANAGYLVDAHAMCWVRILHNPIDEVWRTVSTLEGLQKWWIVPGCVSAFHLKPGGKFAHHWTSTIERFEEFKYIDFKDKAKRYAGTGGTRFELLSLDAGTTRFTFLDTWGPDAQPSQDATYRIAQPGGSGTPWSGVAAGWHRMLDQLQVVLGQSGPVPSYDELCVFYVLHLTELYRWREMVQRR